MLRLVMMSLTGLMFLALVACGGGAPPEEASTAAQPDTQVPAAQSVAVPAASGEKLEQAAARLADGPGAIYVGDPAQLVGLTRNPVLGFGEDGVVPLFSIRFH